jgi:hypothetical protein
MYSIQFYCLYCTVNQFSNFAFEHIFLIQQYSYRELFFKTYLQIMFKTRLLISTNKINNIYGRWNKNHLCITMLNEFRKNPIAEAYAGLSQVAYNICSYPILWGSLYNTLQFAEQSSCKNPAPCKLQTGRVTETRGGLRIRDNLQMAGARFLHTQR